MYNLGVSHITLSTAWEKSCKSCSSMLSAALCCSFSEMDFELIPRASWWLSGKESACNAEDVGDTGSIPGSERPLGGGHGNPLEYSGLENPMDRGAWWATAHTVTKSQTRLKHGHMQCLPHLFSSLNIVQSPCNIEVWGDSIIESHILNLQIRSWVSERLSDMQAWALFSFLFFNPCCAACGTLAPNQGLNPGPLQGKHGVLLTPLPESHWTTRGF